MMHHDIRRRLPAAQLAPQPKRGGPPIKSEHDADIRRWLQARRELGTCKVFAVRLGITVKALHSKIRRIRGLA